MTDFEVGLYNAALPTAMLIMLPHSAIGSLAISSFSELKERDEKSVQDSLQRATYWVFSIVFPTFLILTLFSEESLLLLFGRKYTTASTALMVLALGHLIDASVGQVGSLLQSKGHTQYIFYNNVAALAINLVLNIMLIPTYGVTGAALATASSTAVTNILMFIETWKKEKVISIPFKDISKVVIIASLSIILVKSIDNVLFIDSPTWFLFAGGSIYFVLYILLFLKVIGLAKEEQKVFVRAGERIGYKKESIKILELIEKVF